MFLQIQRVTASVTALVCILCAFTSPVPVIGAEAGIRPQEWSANNTEGAVSYLVGDNGSLTVRFAVQSMPPSYRAGSMVADGGRTGSPFTGNYKASGIIGVSFRIASSGCKPASAMVILGANGSGRVWAYQKLQVSSVRGEWVRNSVSMKRSDGWVTDAKGDLDAMWNEDLQNVGMLAVRFSQGGFAPEDYTVESLRLSDINGFVTSAAVLSRLGKELFDRFGVDRLDQLSASQLALDADRDGVADVGELMAGTNPDDTSSIFTAEVVSADNQEGIVIRWPCVMGGEYQVLRASNLRDGFSVLDTIIADRADYMSYQDKTAMGAGPYFYKIKRINIQ